MAAQSTISSFFSAKSKPSLRSKSPIDLSLEDDDHPPLKKIKVAGKFSPQTTTITSPSPTPTFSTTTAERWRFSQEKSLDACKQRSAAEEALHKKRHEAFKKKLVGENSLFVRKKSLTFNDDENMVVDDDCGRHRSTESSGDEDDETFKALQETFSQKWKGKGKSAASGKTKASVLVDRKLVTQKKEIGPSGQAYTPLELQVRQLKKDHPGTLMFVEVGYKFRFFGDDAKIAAKELGIVCFMDRNFLTASIPVHRREVHLKKLLSQGYRVGIVEQIETAALKKVGDNRSAPFDRTLTQLYTAATHVDGLDSVDDLERYSPPPLLCLVEREKGGMGADEKVTIGMIVICPSTGDVVWDEFDDNHMRTELETRVAHTKPAELLLQNAGLSTPSERLLSHFGVSFGQKIRTERFEGPMSYTDAFSFVSEFCANKSKPTAALDQSGKLMAAITDFPKQVVIALAHTIKYLSAFSIADAFLETTFFTKFTTRANMLLNANTLTNLEIYRNESDFSTKGSLMWILDHTKTKFGARLLKSWVGRPLVDKVVLQDRADAVEEIISSSSEKLFALREVLKNLPDLSKGLCRMQYGKCTPQELTVLLPAFNKIAKAFDPVDRPMDIGFKSNILNEIISSFPKLKTPMSSIIGAVSLKKAAAGRKDLMWNDSDKYPAISDIDFAMQCIDAELQDELKLIRKTLKKPALQFSTINGEDYVVEIRKVENKLVPDTWHLVSRTKIMERYHTPEVRKKIQERAQFQEALDAEANKAFLSFLDEIVQNYYGVLRNAVNNLAIADCLLSFALVALQDGYVRPEFTEDDTLDIVEGRHPMVEALRTDPFVPNTIHMGGAEPRSKCITGPNMGGKSSCVRMIALIVVMAQIGCYVPATSVRMGLLDGVFTRMGGTDISFACDEIVRGRSTFMVEMSETSEILANASERSLVILDELGRGTSTVDGMAVAYAVLRHLVEVTKCKSLFITHYPLVATELERKLPRYIQNLHLGYDMDSRIDGKREITFLYRLTTGIARESFGVECARLARLPEPVLDIATDRSKALRCLVENRSKANKLRKCAHLLDLCVRGDGAGVLAELPGLIDSLSVVNNST